MLVELLERWIAQCPLTYLHVDFREPHMVLKRAFLYSSLCYLLSLLMRVQWHS